MKNKEFKILTVEDVQNILTDIKLKSKHSYLDEMLSPQMTELVNSEILKDIKNGKKKNKKRFAVIDFETANGFRETVCSVGIVIVENNKIIDRFYSLINPQTKYFEKHCVAAHGLRFNDVKNSPKFKDVWEIVDKMIGNSPIVAHNAAFEKSCINACSKAFDTNNDYQYIDTLKLSRKYNQHLSSHKLNVLCEDIGYDLKNYHNALADAEACAMVFIDFIVNKKITEI